MTKAKKSVLSSILNLRFSLSTRSQTVQEKKEHFERALVKQDQLTDRCLTRAFERASCDYEGIVSSLGKNKKLHIALGKFSTSSSPPKIYNLTKEKVEHNQAYQDFKAMLNSQSIDVKIQNVSSYHVQAIFGERAMHPASVSLRLKRRSPSP